MTFTVFLPKLGVGGGWGCYALVWVLPRIVLCCLVLSRFALSGLFCLFNITYCFNDYGYPSHALHGDSTQGHCANQSQHVLLTVKNIFAIGFIWAAQDKARRDKTSQGFALLQPDKTRRLSLDLEKYCNMIRYENNVYRERK